MIARPPTKSLTSSLTARSEDIVQDDVAGLAAESWLSSSWCVGLSVPNPMLPVCCTITSKFALKDPLSRHRCHTQPPPEIPPPPSYTMRPRCTLATPPVAVQVRPGCELAARSRRLDGAVVPRPTLPVSPWMVMRSIAAELEYALKRRFHRVPSYWCRIAPSVPWD